MKDNHFSHLFWFCCGLFILSFGAMVSLLFLHVPEANREMASNAQGFLQGSLITSAVSYLLQGSINPLNKKTVPDPPPPGTTTINLEATSTTAAEEVKPNM